MSMTLTCTSSCVTRPGLCHFADAGAAVVAWSEPDNVHAFCAAHAKQYTNAGWHSEPVMKVNLREALFGEET